MARSPLWLPNVHQRVKLADPIAHHPLTRGLQYFSVAGLHSYGQEWRDLVGRSDGALTDIATPNTAWQGPLGCPGAFSSLGLDGTNDHVEISNAPNLNFGGNITAFVALRSRTFANFSVVFNRRTTGNVGGWTLQFGEGINDQLVWFVYTGAGWQSVTSGTATTADRWYFFTGTYDGANLQIYIDGVEDATPTVAAGSMNNPGSTTPTWIGEYTAGGLNFDGHIASCGVYDRALAADEVYALFQDSRRGYTTLLNRTSSYVPVFSTGTAYELDAEAGAYTITGSDAGLEHDKQVSAEAGSYAIAGSDAGLEHDKQVAADAGSYTITGTDVGLAYGRSINAEAGSYALTGADVGLTATRVVVAEAGSYAISGTDVGLAYGRVIDAEAGSYTITGQDVELVYSGEAGYTIDAEAGSYVITGSDVVALEHDKVLGAEAGAYALTGADVGLAYNRVLTAEAGAYAITGADVSLIKTHVVIAEAGSYAIAGQDVTLTWSAALDFVANVTGTATFNTTAFSSVEFNQTTSGSAEMHQRVTGNAGFEA